MFNLSGSEIIVILLLGLVVLGPDKLPDAMRRAGKLYGELRRLSDSFQDEFRSAIDEPMNEVRQTADMIRKTASFDPIPDDKLKKKSLDPSTTMEPTTSRDAAMSKDAATSKDATLANDAGTVAEDTAVGPGPSDATDESTGSAGAAGSAGAPGEGRAHLVIDALVARPQPAADQAEALAAGFEPAADPADPMR